MANLDHLFDLCAAREEVWNQYPESDSAYGRICSAREEVWKIK